MGHTTATTTAGPSIRSGRSSSSIDLTPSQQQQQQQQQRHSKEHGVNVNVDVIHPISSSAGADAPPLPPDATAADATTDSKPFRPTWRFWAIMMSITTMALCGSVEGTIVVNAMPTIAAALGGGSGLYLWVPNAFFLASIAGLPLYAQMSDIFGRRSMMLGAVSLFVLGSALGGASSSMTMLVVARAVQGLGGGGIDTLCDTIVLDLVPLREQSKYMSFALVGTTVGYAVGPFLGGLIVVKLGWPWVFYINAILGGIALAMFFFFLHVKHRRGQSFLSKVKRIDIGGNAIFIGSVIAVLLAFTWGGPVYRWDSVQIVVPLVIGLLGLGAFTAFEWTPRLAPEPSFPRAVVSNRTSATVLAMTLVNSIATFGTFYFLPVYFQGVLVKTPLESGIGIVPISACVVPFAVIAGVLLSKLGKYKPIHVAGWSAILIAAGLCSTLGRNSTPAAWASFEVLSAAGLGTLSVSLLPALQAPLDERYAATSTGMFGFARSFGAIWGVTIPSSIFNNAVSRTVAANANAFAANPSVAARLIDGQAYELATSAFLDSLAQLDQGGIIRDQVISAFEHAIQVVFYVMTAFAGLGLLMVLLEKEIPMRTENNAEFGLEETERPGEHASAEDGVALAAGRSRRSTTSYATREPVSRATDEIPLEEWRGPLAQQGR